MRGVRWVVRQIVTRARKAATASVHQLAPTSTKASSRRHRGQPRT
ncbi:hypothetical protein [Streptomyces sp. KR80]